MLINNWRKFRTNQSIWRLSSTSWMWTNNFGSSYACNCTWVSLFSSYGQLWISLKIYYHRMRMQECLMLVAAVATFRCFVQGLIHLPESLESTILRSLFTFHVKTLQSRSDNRRAKPINDRIMIYSMRTESDFICAMHGICLIFELEKCLFQTSFNLRMMPFTSELLRMFCQIRCFLP